MRFNKVCRICLSENDSMESIFTFNNDVLLKFHEMVMSFANVNISENDGLPAQLCKTCSSKLLEMHHFKKQCENTDIYLKRFVKGSVNFMTENELDSVHDGGLSNTFINTNFGDPDKKSDDDCNNYVDDEHSKDVSICEISENKDLQENEIIKHDTRVLKKRKDDINIIVFACRKCDFNFLSWDELNKHNELHSFESNEQNLHCRYCGKKFLHQRNINPHIRQAHSNLDRFQCSYCGIRWHDKRTLKSHFMKHVVEGQVVTDSQLNKDFCSIPDINLDKPILNVQEINQHSKFTKETDFCDSANTEETKEKSQVADGNFCVEHKNIRSIKTKLSPKVEPNIILGIFQTTTNLIEHAAIKLQCEICNRYFKSKKDLKRHEATHDPDKPYHCSVNRCRWSFGSEHELKVHVNVNHSDGKHECSFCNKVFKHSRNLRQHMLQHKLTKRFNCQYCNKGFNHHHHLQNHERIHTGDLPFLCQECGHSFSTKDRLTFHIRRHSDNRPYACKECDKRFISTTDLKIHTKTHTGDRPFMCSICGRTFTTKYNLNKHSRVQHSTNGFGISDVDAPEIESEKVLTSACNICGFLAESLQQLDQHMKTHTCQYFCPSCPKSYSLTSALEAHIKTHSAGNRSHTCVTCGWSFNRAEHLRSHMLRKHNTKGKIIKCLHCPRTFARTTDLTAHMRIHTQIRPYKCTECGRCFTQSGALRIHLRVHTGERPYICGVCHHAHRSAGALATHMRTHSSHVSIEKKISNSNIQNTINQENSIEIDLKNVHPINSTSYIDSTSSVSENCKEKEASIITLDHFMNDNIRILDSINSNTDIVFHSS